MLLYLEVVLIGGHCTPTLQRVDEGELLARGEVHFILHLDKHQQLHCPGSTRGREGDLVLMVVHSHAIL